MEAGGLILGVERLPISAGSAGPRPVRHALPIRVRGERVRRSDGEWAQIFWAIERLVHVLGEGLAGGEQFADARLSGLCSVALAVLVGSSATPGRGHR